jgi:hypothetical protein
MLHEKNWCNGKNFDLQCEGDRIKSLFLQPRFTLV